MSDTLFSRGWTGGGDALISRGWVDSAPVVRLSQSATVRQADMRVAGGAHQADYRRRYRRSP